MRSFRNLSLSVICPKCSYQNPDGAKTCVNCGVTLTSPLDLTPQPQTDIVPHQPWFRRKIFTFTALALMLFLIIGVSLYALSQKTATKIPPEEARPQVVSPQPASEELAKTKYEVDADGDGIPDFVEVALGFNPKQSAELACIQQGCLAGVDLVEEVIPQVNLIFILDSSGSMAEKIGNQTKMDIAKQALRNYVEKLPKNINFGLVVYGHKGSNNVADKAVSCQGIETIYPISQPNKEEFLTKIETFQPTGWTPMGGSLRFAKAELQKTGIATNYIVLVSDGIETCASDPVGAAKEVVSAGVNIQIDVIGFAVDQKTKEQLSQIAQIAGGQYFEATSAPEFANILDQTLQKLQKLQELIQCTGERIAAYRKCNSDYYQPAIDYLEKLAQEVFKRKDEISKAEYTTILNTKSKLYTRLSINLRRNSTDLWKVYRDAFFQISETAQEQMQR